MSASSGAGHNFHRHPTQEELITVSSGQIEQWLGEASTVLGPGDSAYVDPGLVHASFNTTGDTVHLRVVIAPSVATATGYELEDVSAEEPWASLRRALRVETAAFEEPLVPDENALMRPDGKVQAGDGSTAPGSCSCPSALPGCAASCRPGRRRHCGRSHVA